MGIKAHNNQSRFARALKGKILITIVLSMLSQVSYAVDSTYNVVVAGKTCKERKDQIISCRYEVGKSLLIEIAGIGAPDTGIVFLKSDFDGDYYGKYGLLHGCIIISSTKNLFNLAFVSPKNGKVYKEWRECKKGF